MMWVVALVFLLGAGAVLGAYAALTRVPDLLSRRRLDRRLKDVTLGIAATDEEAALVMRQSEGAMLAVDQLVSRVRGGNWLKALVEQSGCRTTPGAVIVMTIGLGVGAGLLAGLLAAQPYVPPIAGLAAAVLPLTYLMNRRSARLRVFEEHFPEALDLMSRALRAGHAFQTSLGMVADEMETPIGPEFRKTFDQQNFGLPLRDALAQMTERVPLLDMRFFVTAVLIQRETGGNLSEILDNLAHVVRERFKIRRQIRVHTAHGRFTAFVLLALPAALAVVLSYLNPEHMEPLLRDRLGHMILIVAMIMQAIGFFWIRRVIKIEV